MMDLTGQKFGRLTVLERAEKYKNRQPQWKCQCDCGNKVIVRGCNLTSGHTKSCGCLISDKPKTHGGAGTRLYKIWRSMIERCSYKRYKDYCARGIVVCEEWRNSFEAFRDWALANEYDETAPRGQYTIDRIDVNGNYEPANCRWATMKEQQNNKRNNLNVSINGVTKTVPKWADEAGIKYGTLYQRLMHGWKPEDAINTPVKGGNHEIRYSD